jgi:hypothetical protein
MRHKLVTLGLLAALLLAVLAPMCVGRASAAVPAAPVATSAQTHAAFLDKTRFLAHAGIAFFIIHHEYRRYQQGYFSAGTPGRVRHLVVAAIALGFAVHEAKVAYGIAEKSHSKTLHVLASPFAALAATVDGIRGKFAKGQGSADDLATLNSTADGINSTASSNGFGDIKDVSPPPGVMPSGA